MYAFHLFASIDGVIEAYNGGNNVNMGLLTQLNIEKKKRQKRE